MKLLPKGFKKSRLLGKYEGNDWASLTKFHSLAIGQSHTVTLFQTKNGKSICGGYLKPAWIDSQWTSDPSAESFIFTLVNSAGTGPKKFPLGELDFAGYCRVGGFQFGHSGALLGYSGPYTLNLRSFP
jgi:hypothetical protein